MHACNAQLAEEKKKRREVDSEEEDDEPEGGLSCVMLDDWLFFGNFRVVWIAMSLVGELLSVSLASCAAHLSVLRCHCG